MRTRVLTMVLRRSGASLAIHPPRIAVLVVFLLPDRHAMFDFIDDVAARAEGFVAMRGTHADPDGDVGERQRSHAMHARGARDAIPLDGFLHDARAFLLGKLRIRFVFQARDGHAFVVIAHPAFERRETAAGDVPHLALQGCSIERCGTELERFHPPATGGMKTTASPALSGCDHSPNSELMATRSMSTGSVKG